MSTPTAIERMRQALRPIDDDGQSHGGPDGWSPTPEEINEWEETFREVANPTTIRALLDELDALRVDAERYRALRDGEDESAIDSIFPFSLWENTHWLKRGKHLDKVADAARAAINTKEAT